MTRSNLTLLDECTCYHEHYIPEIREQPPVVDPESTWFNISTIIKDIIFHFNLKTDKVLEFGVWLGCSTSALAHYFKEVIGTDIIIQEEAKTALAGYSNIKLIQESYQEFIEHDEGMYDLIHIDIIHTYEDTYRNGLWAIKHSNCVIFHDTAMPSVRHAVEDLAAEFKEFKFYNFEECCWLGILVKGIIKYKPIILESPKTTGLVSSWGEIPTILKDIIVRFDLKTNIALEFGVLQGYSTSALAYYFKKVIGVDPFKGNFLDTPGEIVWDSNADTYFTYDLAKETLKDFPNIELMPIGWEEFARNNEESRYDLIHIDTIHDYENTFPAGDWALQHSDCVIFHDTLTARGVMEAVTDLADKYKLDFYNYSPACGLGILVNK